MLESLALASGLQVDAGEEHRQLRRQKFDAVVSADPFMSRITESGAGYVASYYSTFLPENNQTIVHAAKREWVAKNPATARAFREALVESGAFMQQAKNDAKVRTAIGSGYKPD